VTQARQYGSATVHRIVDLDVYPMPIDMIFPGKNLSEIAHARDILDRVHADFEANHLFLTIQAI
jgi:hypothetical protein